MKTKKKGKKKQKDREDSDAMNAELGRTTVIHRGERKLIVKGGIVFEDKLTFDKLHQSFSKPAIMSDSVTKNDNIRNDLGLPPSTTFALRLNKKPL